MRKLTKVCCVCQRVEQGNRWLSGIAFTEEQLTHGYCPKCFVEVIADIEAYAVKQSFGSSPRGGRSLY